MKNPFKRKKASRFRGYQPSKEELQEEFDELLKHRVSQRMKLELGNNKDMVAFFKYRVDHGDRIQAEEKEKLLAEMKASGYSRAIELTRQPGQDVLLKKIIGGQHE
jgi:hypothetical protein